MAMHYYIKYNGADMHRLDNQGVVFLGGTAAFLTASTALILNAGISNIVM